MGRSGDQEAKRSENWRSGGQEVSMSRGQEDQVFRSSNLELDEIR